ncbi:hypothetical protein B0H12DRAFT_1135772, partial [Mycena haematopus]
SWRGRKIHSMRVSRILHTQNSAPSPVVGGRVIQHRAWKLEAFILIFTLLTSRCWHWSRRRHIFMRRPSVRTPNSAEQCSLLLSFRSGTRIRTSTFPSQDPKST